MFGSSGGGGRASEAGRVLGGGFREVRIAVEVVVVGVVVVVVVGCAAEEGRVWDLLLDFDLECEA